MAIVASLVDQPSKLLLASKLPNLPKKQTNKPPNEEVTVGSWNALGTVYTESGYCKSLHVRSRLLGRDGFDLEAQHPFFFGETEAQHPNYPIFLCAKTSI